ncbi:hypothetical protein [Methanolobus psychrotolerans]|uniref:hypothetical protein n=1 Tax=Methanolobus psychrotolerans TaxID=1874706 RepID=UPI0013EC3D8C|nr:hypothetical protein [Methanolobus psychrotolerans]
MKSKPNEKKRAPEDKDSIVVPKYDDDANYKPMLRGVINTHCDYDGGKVEGHQE